MKRNYLPPPDPASEKPANDRHDRQTVNAERPAAFSASRGFVPVHRVSFPRA